MCYTKYKDIIIHTHRLNEWECDLNVCRKMYILVEIYTSFRYNVCLQIIISSPTRVILPINVQRTVSGVFLLSKKYLITCPGVLEMNFVRAESAVQKRALLILRFTGKISSSLTRTWPESFFNTRGYV